MIWHMRVAPRLSIAARLGVLFGLLSGACNNDWSVPKDVDAAQTANATTDADATTVADTTTDADADATTVADATADANATAEVSDTESPEGQASSAALPDAEGDSSDGSDPGDAGTPVDANMDTNSVKPDADTGPVATAPFCQNVEAIYCRDYEGADALDFNWTEVTTTSQASLTIADQAATSHTHTLKSTLTGVADETAAGAVWLLDTAPGSFRASFDFLPQLSLPADNTNLMFWFRLIEQSGDNYPGISLASRHDGTYLVVSNFDGTSSSFDMHATEELPSGWVHVSLEVTGGPQGNATVRFNDTLAVEYQGLVQVADVSQSFASIGLYTQGAPASTAFYDNVVIHATP